MISSTGSSAQTFKIFFIILGSLLAFSAASAENRIDVAGKTESCISQRENKDSVVTETFSIYFKLNEVSVDRTYLDNEESIRRILQNLKYSNKVDSLVICSYSSPEGSCLYNDKLAIKRAEAAKRFILDNVRDSIITAGKIKLHHVAENWDGLYEEVYANYHRWDRDWVLKTLNADVSPETKEWRFKNHDDGLAWKLLKRDYMSKLRVATLISVSYPVLFKETEEIVLPTVLSEVKDTLKYERADAIEYEYQPPVFKKTVVALKTNMLYDAVTALNFEVEIPLGNRFSIMAEDVFPWWTWGPHKNKYAFQMWELGLEPRWWFIKSDKRDRLAGHFLGIYGMVSKYDFQWDTKACYQGEYWSAGLTYGYAMPVCKWLNLEFSLSVGYVNSPYRHYFPDEDYEVLYRDKYKTGTFKYFGPTKAKVSLVLPISCKYTLGKKTGKRK